MKKTTWFIILVITLPIIGLSLRYCSNSSSRNSSKPDEELSTANSQNINAIDKDKQIEYLFQRYNDLAAKMKQDSIYFANELRSISKGKSIAKNEVQKKPKIEILDLDKPNVVSGKNYFTIGDDQNEVLRIMGDPTDIIGRGGDASWYYGLASIDFDNGRVSSYSNYDNKLKVRLKK